MDSILQNTDHVEWLWGETDDIFISERIIHEMAEKDGSLTFIMSAYKLNMI